MCYTHWTGCVRGMGVDGIRAGICCGQSRDVLGKISVASVWAGMCSRQTGILTRIRSTCIRNFYYCIFQNNA